MWASSALRSGGRCRLAHREADGGVDEDGAVAVERALAGEDRVVAVREAELEPKLASCGNPDRSAEDLLAGDERDAAVLGQAQHAAVVAGDDEHRRLLAVV